MTIRIRPLHPTIALLAVGLLILPTSHAAAQALGTLPPADDMTHAVVDRPTSLLVRRPDPSPPMGVAIPHAGTTIQGAAPKSRARGARRGFLIGALGGALLGLVITNDFLDEPVVNAAAGAGVFGIIGAGVGALVGSTPPATTAPAPRGSYAP